MQRLDTVALRSKEQSTIKVYLVGSTNRWNAGKKAELKDRVSHISGEKIIK